MWKTVKLGDAAKPVGGSGFPKKYQGKKDGEVPFFKVSDMNLQKNEKFMTSANNYVSRETLKAMKAKAYPAGTIIFPKIGGAISTNKKRILVCDSAFDNNVMGLVPSDDVLSEYLYNIFLNLDLYELSNKAALPSITATSVKEVALQLPPLAEQQRIVAKLDAAFAEIDGAIEAVVTKETEVQKLKASLLSSSLGGNDVVWETVKLGDVCDLVGGGTPSKKNDDYYDGDIPWATVRDMNVEELTVTEHKITELGLKNSSSKVIPANNVIIASRVGLGKVCILRQDTAINQDLRGVIPKRENEIDKSFLFYWFKGIASKIIGAGRGATVQGVTLPFLNSLSFPLPPLAEQQRIVAKLDAAFAAIEAAHIVIKKKKENCKALKLAILAQELQSEAA